MKWSKTGESGAGLGTGGRSTRKLYGRASETAMLTSALDAVAGRRSRAVSLEGAAGTGKSTLLNRVRADARRRGWTVLSGRATVLETGYDFGVLRQAVAGLAPLPDGRPVSTQVTAPEEVSPFTVFEQVSAHVLKAMAAAPVLITVDDVQWCDPLSLRWLAYLVHRSADLPLALVLADSPGEVSEVRPLVDELSASCERWRLRRLTSADVRPWIADALGTRPDEAFVESCLRATGGNAALLAALLPELAARSVPPVGASSASIEGAGRAGACRWVLPWINRGGPHALAVARAVAVLGEESEPVLVAELADLDLADAARAVDRLIKLDVLSDTSPLRYVHALARTVVEAGMSAGLRTSHRLRAAHVVGDRYAAPERAAAHLMAIEVTGEPWALDTLRAAAAAARDRGDVQRELGYLRRALTEPMPVAARAELLTDVGAAEAAAGDPTAETTLVEAAGLAAAPSLRVRIGVDLAYLDAAAGRPLDAALKIVDEAGAQVPPERAALVAEAEFGVFFASASAGGLAEFFERRLPRLRELTAGDARLTALTGVVDAWLEIRRGRDRAACVRHARAALGAIDPHKPWEAGLRLLAVGALITADEDDPTTTERAPDHHAMTRDATIRGYLHGRLLHGRGELSTARTRIDAALDDPFVAGALGIAPLVRVLADLGELDAADRLIGERVPGATKAPNWATTAYAYARAALSVIRERHAEAREGFLAAGDGLRAMGVDNPAVLPWRSQAARSGAALGDTDTSSSLVTEEVDLARQWGAPRALSVALAAYGLVHEDLDAAREAVTVLDPLAADLHRATALVDLGTVGLATGADEARDNLQDGYALARTIGAMPIARRASRQLRSVGGRPDLARISGVNALTTQERVAAQHAATGATNRQIAETMVLTQRTVEQYLTSTYRKLGISGRRDLPAALSD
ncbi:LuxR family transcriptional regulator [Actinomadura meridiana]|uniref:LuxR family transcriptional regulator n=1 Tax=Actinomadura meridiana TaxID=559626 RepID=A0ABP8C814_9ACTN